MAASHPLRPEVNEQVETSEAMEAEVDQVRERIAGRLTDQEIVFDQVAVTEGLRIEVTGVPDAQDSVARDELENTVNWSLTGSSTCSPYM